MTSGTVQSFDLSRGFGYVQSAMGSKIPFSSTNPFLPGTRVTFGVRGGMAGTYAVDVLAMDAPSPVLSGPAVQCQTTTSSIGFRFRSGTVAPLAG